MTSALQELFTTRYGTAIYQKCRNPLNVDEEFYINRRSRGGNKHYHIECAKLVHLL